jgi:DNA repair protein RadD
MTSLPDRIAQLFRLMLGSDKPGEVAAATATLNRTLVAAGRDLHWAAEVLAAAPDAPADKEANGGVEWIAVDSFALNYHRKAGSKPGLRVSYRCGTATYFDFWALQHTGMAREIAIEKWFDLGGEEPAPRPVNQAIDRIDELADDIEIAVERDGPYWRVVGQRVREEVPA